jgi:hypothetical protein
MWNTYIYEGSKVNKEYKEKWVEALRSGKYKQGKGCLKKGDEYCCLGVLCDIVDPEYLGVNGHRSHLPYHILDKTGMETPDGRLNYNVHTFISLIGLNDGAEYTFDQIADVIEEQF